MSENLPKELKAAEQQLRHYVAEVRGFKWPKPTVPPTQVRLNAEARYESLKAIVARWQAKVDAIKAERESPR